MKKLISSILAFGICLSNCISQSSDTPTYSIFSGRVISIAESYHKEGTFAEIKIRVDSIHQIDTITSALPGYHDYLNQTRLKKHNSKKPLIATLLVQPELCDFQISARYLVYTKCCNVDYYYSDLKRTKRIDD